MISIIIPCYNAADFIKETLDSIKSQNVDELEIIVVDDGSTDSSASIILSEKDSRLLYLRQENSGVSVARNSGLSVAKGEYVIFFDADDKMSDGFLSLRKRVLDSDHSLDFCCGPVVTFPVPGEETYGPADDIIDGLLTYKQYYSSCPSNYLIRKSSLTENRLNFNPILSSTADRFFLIELASFGKGKLIKEAPLLYRISSNSMSNKLSSKLVLDNETYLHELQRKGLIPQELEDEFMFKICYILGLGFIRTGLYFKGMKYVTSAFLKKPVKFVEQIYQ
jgi:glycosyltransferase involved in cell wall biosynthesis